MAQNYCKQVQWCRSAVATSLLALAACSGSDDGANTDPRRGATDEAETPREPVEPMVGDRRVPFAPEDDRAFLGFFSDHQQIASELASQELERGTHADVRAFAQRVLDAGDSELDSMQEIADALGESSNEPMPSDPHLQAELRHMETLEGNAMDATFLTEMIAHRASALPVAHRALTTLQSAELRALAADMLATHAAEIGALQALRDRLGVRGAGQDIAGASPTRADFGMEGDVRIPLTPTDDLEFIDFFAPHHQLAVVFANLVITGGEDPAVREMALAMRDAQTAELDRMAMLRAVLTGDAAPQSPPIDPHTYEEAKTMPNLSGAELDREFLAEMVAHHAAAIPTSHRARPHVQNADLQLMADAIFETQAREVGAMQRMLQGAPVHGVSP